RPSVCGRSSNDADSRSLRTSPPRREPPCLPGRAVAPKLRATRSFVRGITGTNGLSFVSACFLLVRLDNDVEAVCAGVVAEGLRLGGILAAGEVALEAAAGIVPELQAAEAGRCRASDDGIRAVAIGGMAEDGLQPPDWLPFDAFERDEEPLL